MSLLSDWFPSDHRGVALGAFSGHPMDGMPSLQAISLASAMMRALAPLRFHWFRSVHSEAKPNMLAPFQLLRLPRFITPAWFWRLGIGTPLFRRSTVGYVHATAMGKGHGQWWIDAPIVMLIGWHPNGAEPGLIRCLLNKPTHGGVPGRSGRIKSSLSLAFVAGLAPLFGVGWWYSATSWNCSHEARTRGRSPRVLSKTHVNSSS